MGDTIFFIADKEERAAYYAGQLRTELGQKLELLEKNAYRFCYINDFPMFERDPETKPDRLYPQSLLHAAGRSGGA